MGAVSGAILILAYASLCGKYRREGRERLLSDLVRGAWLWNVRQQNPDIIGEATDLTEFLFGSERASLAAVRGVLQEIEPRCFYCESVLRPTTTEVDHFISWSRYPADLGHNFVLADRSCNNRKRDRLPAYQHLCACVERNELHNKRLSTDFEQTGVLHNLTASMRVANWAYSQTEAAKGLTWLKADDLVPLPWEWRRKLEGI